MVDNRYLNNEYTKEYYKTLICTASYFARCEEAAEIFKQCNEDENLQDVIFIC
jgi:hypothetical protein